MRKPSRVQHTPLGCLKLSDGAKGFTSSATPSLLRSVTAQSVVLRVPTNSMLVEGATAMWRASGTMAYSSILKPGGTLTFFRLLRIAWAFLPSCATAGRFRSVLATRICFIFSMLDCAAAPVERPAASSAHVSARTFMLGSLWVIADCCPLGLLLKMNRGLNANGHITPRRRLVVAAVAVVHDHRPGVVAVAEVIYPYEFGKAPAAGFLRQPGHRVEHREAVGRSEEHTSELQSL